MFESELSTPANANASERMRILCVDDEPAVLEGLQLKMRRRYEVQTACGGEAGLNRLVQEGPFSVVISDMRMPGMDGAVFLKKVRDQDPDTVRILLTGQADAESAAAAINEGEIFRFLVKPCAREELFSTLELALHKRQSRQAERALLEQTLRGTVKALVDVLALTQPVVFGTATRVQSVAAGICEALHVRESWIVELAAMAWHLGAISLPPALVEKMHSDAPLSEKDNALIQDQPKVVRRLLGGIPRLEKVLELLDACRLSGASGAQEQGLEAAILSNALAFDALERRGMSGQEAAAILSQKPGRYTHAVTEALKVHLGEAETNSDVQEVLLKDVSAGMTLLEDLRTRSGVLLARKGYEVSESFLHKVRGFGRNHVREPFMVRTRRGSESV